MDNGEQQKLNFQDLVLTIRDISVQMSSQAMRAVNISLTLRNWLIGCYIDEFEMCGSDRATYGEQLFDALARELNKYELCIGRRQLYNCRAFYKVYPQIVQTLNAQLLESLPRKAEIMHSMNAQIPGELFAPVVADIAIVETLSPQSSLSGRQLLDNLSFSHFVVLINLDDQIKRAFYEMECIKGGWSVRELKRQISSLYYERSGLSVDKAKLAEIAQKDAEKNDLMMVIRDPYVFEFLGLKPSEVMSESLLENQLLDKLQAFLLELGHGFCFEARQKRILIGDSHYFVDLVFYHRILKCHILVELKVEEFSHENIGQLNTYVSWFRKNMMSEGDNPPIGILLCTHKNQALVEYALAGLDNMLFVSRYQLELPKKEEMQSFLQEQMKEAGYGQ